jgi:hypothetical protein
MSVLKRRVVPTTMAMVCCWLALTLGAAQRTGGGPAKCPPIQARNPQEALMMEAASQKAGCWTRGADGQLVFVNDKEGPDTANKPPTAQRSANMTAPVLPPPPAGRCFAPARKVQELALEAQQKCLNDPLYGPNSVGFAPAPVCRAADNRAEESLASYCSCLGFTLNPDPPRRDVGAFYPSITGGMRRRPVPRPAGAYPALCTETGDWLPARRSAIQNGFAIRPASYRLQVAYEPQSLTRAQIEAAIRKGADSSEDTQGLHLVDAGRQFSQAIGLLAAQQGQLQPGTQVSASGFQVFMFTPATWIAEQSRIRWQNGQPMEFSDVTTDMRRSIVRVVALPSTPPPVGTNFGLGVSSVTSVTLSDSARRVRVPPLRVSPLTWERMSGLTAEFALDDLAEIRRADSEFLIVVKGPNSSKEFKVKRKNFSAIPM